MINYNKLVKLLKKEFPDVTQEEIDQMVSQVPMHLPLPLVFLAIKATRLKMQSPEAFAKLKTKNWNTIGSDCALEGDEENDNE